ncbi:MAG TPA: DinB family protein [Actinomycetes bacterium]|nr:DinB family protein [Actinomycetes bacterium]
MEERIVAADPVADPIAYQQELLVMLGDRDPVAVLAATPQAVQEQTAGLPAELLGRRPEPEEWSIVELLGHMWDAEVVYSFRTRSVLTQDAPGLPGYDQATWVRLPRPPFTELLAAFTGLRNANVALARSIPAAAWERAGLHPQRGMLSIRLMTREVAGHDLAHTRQLEQTVAAVRR